MIRQAIAFYCIALTMSGFFVQEPALCQVPLSFSLKQAQDYAYENNYDLKNSRFDVEIARKMVKQNTSIGFPQINAGADYSDYLQLATWLIPGEFINQPGKEIPIQFGSKYNFTFRATASQIIYSGQYLVGLRTAKAFLETSRQKMMKDQMDVRDLVTDAYITFLIIQENVRILDSTYITVSQMVKEAKEILRNGLIEDIDVDQLELNQSNLEATLMNIKNQRLVAYNYLKFVMGLNENQQIVLTDNLNYFLSSLGYDALMSQSFDYNRNIDYKLLKKQQYMALMQYKLSKTSYHPTLTAFIGFNENAQRNSWNFFQAYQPWYMTSSWGLSLTIPIWSSGIRKYSVDQARLNVEKMKVLDAKTKVALSLQLETQRNEFNNYYRVFLNKQKGLETARKIYDKTVAKYRQGISSSTDLNQKYNQFLDSESEYIQSLMDLLKSRIKFSKLLEQV
ncbi:MAG: TolC family protein [Bacteroidota bacterium]|nr:TolC family protein [Bacteroidota bacterium]